MEGPLITEHIGSVDTCTEYTVMQVWTGPVTLQNGHWSALLSGVWWALCVCAGVRGHRSGRSLWSEDVICLRITASVCPQATGRPSVGGSVLAESVLAENESTAPSQIALGAPVVPQPSGTPAPLLLPPPARSATFDLRHTALSFCIWCHITQNHSTIYALLLQKCAIQLKVHACVSVHDSVCVCRRRRASELRSRIWREAGDAADQALGG